MTYEAATQIWNDMTPMDRVAVMQQVPYNRSVTKMHRACVAFIQKGA